jgi:hypothetical protein
MGLGMTYSMKLMAVTLLFFTLFSNGNAETATATQHISVHIPKVNLLAIPDSMLISLTQDGEGYYSGTGHFSYAITTNNALETKRILANVSSANLGEQGRLTITMQSPTGVTKTTVFQQDAIENKILVETISNVAKKNIPFSITLTKLSASLVQPYIDPNTASIAYPLQMTYILSN